MKSEVQVLAMITFATLTGGSRYIFVWPGDCAVLSGTFGSVRNTHQTLSMATSSSQVSTPTTI